MELKKEIYSSWAFKENGREKAKINMEIYKELTEKHKTIVSARKIENPEEHDVVIEYNVGYGHWLGRIIVNKPNLSNDELALLLDGGNLCFGYGLRDGGIAIYTD